jgi:hypothetical protein
MDAGKKMPRKGKNARVLEREEKNESTGEKRKGTGKK